MATTPRDHGRSPQHAESRAVARRYGEHIVYSGLTAARGSWRWWRRPSWAARGKGCTLFACGGMTIAAPHARAVRLEGFPANVKHVHVNVNASPLADVQRLAPPGGGLHGHTVRQPRVPGAPPARRGGTAPPTRPVPRQR